MAGESQGGSDNTTSYICCGCLALVLIILVALPAGFMGGLSGEAPGSSGGSGGSGGGGDGTLSEDCCVEYIKKKTAVALSNDEMKQYCKWIQNYSSLSGVSPALTAAIITQESHFNTAATSYVGAAGLMQLMPDTGIEMGVLPAERYDPEKNINAGTRYLKKIRDDYLNESLKGNQDNVIASYNAGAGNVNKYGGVPPFTETQDYVVKVNGYYTEVAKCLTSTVASGDCGTQAQKAVYFANKQVGKTYSQSQPSYGDIDYDHFDCAGLYSSAWYYAEVFKIRHTFVPSFYKPYDELNYFQISTRSDMLAKMQPGDAVFAGAFDNAADQTPDYSGQPSPVHDYGHIGMYIGDGKVTEAKGTDYGVVTTQFLNGSWALEYGRPKGCSGTTVEGTLQERVEAKTKEWQNKGIGQVGILIQGPGENAQIKQGEKFISASVIKVYIAISTLKKVEAGQLDLASIKNDLYDMLHRSGNDSTNRLIDKVGGFTEINKVVKDLGLSNSIIQRKMSEPNSSQENYTSPTDINTTFKMLESGNYLNSEHRNLIKQYLTNTDPDDENALAKVKGSGVTVTHKIGSLDKSTYGYWVDNDTGIIYLNNQPIYISVFSQNNNIGGYEQQDAFIADIARVTVDYFKNK